MDLRLFQDIPLYCIFVLKRHLLAEVYACALRKNYLLAAPCVCCADVSAAGATLFTQTPARRVTVAGSRLFRAECSLRGGLGVGEQNLIGPRWTIVFTKLNFKIAIDLEMSFLTTCVVIVSYYEKNTVNLNLRWDERPHFLLLLVTNITSKVSHKWELMLSSCSGSKQVLKH